MQSLADAAQISRVSLGKLEAARCRPRPDTARRLADALDLSVAEIFPEVADTD